MSIIWSLVEVVSSRSRRWQDDLLFNGWIQNQIGWSSFLESIVEQGYNFTLPTWIGQVACLDMKVKILLTLWGLILYLTYFFIIIEGWQLVHQPSTKQYNKWLFLWNHQCHVYFPIHWLWGTIMHRDTGKYIDWWVIDIVTTKSTTVPIKSCFRKTNNRARKRERSMLMMH